MANHVGLHTSVLISVFNNSFLLDYKGLIKSNTIVKINYSLLLSHQFVYLFLFFALMNVCRKLFLFHCLVMELCVGIYKALNFTLDFSISFWIGWQ